VPLSSKKAFDQLNCPVDQCSIDLRLGLRLTVFKKKDYAVFRTKMTKEMFEEAHLWEEREYQEHEPVTLEY
jgi:hypothetical protein